jgi:hypothetical protein
MRRRRTLARLPAAGARAAAEAAMALVRAGRTARPAGAAAAPASVASAIYRPHAACPTRYQSTMTLKGTPRIHAAM